MRLSLSRKLQIPSAFMILLVLLILGAFGMIRQNVQQSSSEAARLKEMEVEIRWSATMARDFAAGQAEFAEVGKRFQAMGAAIDPELFGAFMARHEGLITPDDTWAQIEEVASYHRQHEAAQQEVDQLTGDSIAMSRKYIGDTSQRLADPDSEAEVTQLERLVIAGADANNALNFEIQVRFERMRREGSGEAELLALLDESIRNSTTDVKRLADTPFAQLPVQALRSNERVREVVQAYVADLKNEAAVSEHLLEEMRRVIAAIETDVKEATEASYANILRTFQFFILIVVTIAAIVLTVSALIGRSLSRSIAGTISVVAQVAEGDTDLQAFQEFMNRRTHDEIDDLRRNLRTMAGSLQDRAHLAATIARGDLTPTVEVTSQRDQLGMAIRDMSQGLNDLVRDIQSAGYQINVGTQQVSDASQSLSQGATEQASSIEEINSSMTEIHSQIRQNSESAGTANQHMVEAKDIVEQTMAVMGKMSLAMSDIDASSQEISKINKVIDDIAFQTNLLALNAAVEAARAGSHGKGFAVVAEEVRNLAGRSAKAAREASGLVEETLAKVGTGTQFITELESSFVRVVESAGNVAQIVEAIAADSNRQAEGVGQINVGLNQIDQVTQSNAATAEESAAAVQELSSMATELTGMLARFKVENQGGEKRPPAHRQQPDTAHPDQPGNWPMSDQPHTEEWEYSGQP
jgi:methyl-accepting chemotaxis protein